MREKIRATGLSFAVPAYAALLVLSACTINPVTGQRELALVSAESEVSIGQAQYAPSRQMQGGDYVRDPALQSYVREVGQRLAAVSDRNLPYEFVVLNSSVPNAWALPGGKIAINRGLLVELNSEAELAAVLGHEIVHAAARHGALAMQRGMLLQGAVLATQVASRRGDYSGLAVGAASLGAQLINTRNGREAELESDRYGMEYMSRAGYDPRAAIDLQETFLRLSEDRADQGRLARLFASHPPSAERVTQNRATAAAMPATGEIGRERYQAAIADLLATRPAYAAYDDARRALADDNLQEAESLAGEAVRLVNNEAQFHALLGDIDLASDRPDQAIAHYDNAIREDGQFFYFPLQKGVAHQRNNQWTLAEEFFLASVSLLPTANAYLGLGQVAEERGDRDAALTQYRRAAEASGETGEAAQDAMVRLDLPTNPGQYIQSRTSLDSAGSLLVEIANPTRYAVADLVMLIRYADPQGRVQQIRRVLSNPLPANGVQRIPTRLGPFGPNQPHEVTLESARIVSR